jgi:hypothetical protein
MLNPFYEKKEVLSALQKAFKQRGSVAIGEVLDSHINLKGWKRKSIPDRYSYEEHANILVQKELRAFVKKITGKTPLREKNRRFSHRDYTILHDKELQKPGIIGLLFLDEWDESWGGKIVFMKNGTTLEQFVPKKNVLLIIERKKGAQYFIKYINHRAKKKLTIISA